VGDSPVQREPRLALRPREAAEALGISARTLWTWTKEGRVPCVRLGGSIRYPVSCLTHWLEEQALATRATPKATSAGGEP
jgi:excisionase family DNA binding protein